MMMKIIMKSSQKLLPYLNINSTTIRTIANIIMDIIKTITGTNIYIGTNPTNSRITSNTINNSSLSHLQDLLINGNRATTFSS